MEKKSKPLNKSLHCLFRHTAFRFALVGVVNTVFGTAVMFFAYHFLGCSYWVASAANYVFGSMLSYFLNKYFTFQSRERSWKEVWRFSFSIAVCYFLAYGVAQWAVAGALQLYSATGRDNIAMSLGVVLFIVFNYFSQKLFVFRKKSMTK